MVEEIKNQSWICCEKCSKKLLKRKSNGVFIFKFGKNKKQEDVVYLEVMGSIRIKCFRENCGFLNNFSFFPNT